MTQAWDFVDADVLWGRESFVSRREKLLARKIEDINWDQSQQADGARSGTKVRIINAMRVENIKTIGDLIEHPAGFYRTLPNFGNKSFAVVKAVLAQHGLMIREGYR
jgi:DNA-directed RNA polymerase alpha subunit